MVDFWPAKKASTNALERACPHHSRENVIHQVPGGLGGTVHNVAGREDRGLGGPDGLANLL